MTELTLSAQFIIAIMKVAFDENKFRIHEAAEVCDQCIPEVDEYGECFWHLHPTGPENIRLVSIEPNEHYGLPNSWDGKIDECTHKVTISYTSGTTHKNRDQWALYGVNEELNIIDLWAS